MKDSMKDSTLCPSLFSAYASGTMDEGLALIVASYLSFCPQARAQVGACQTMGGAMLETLCEPVDMGAQSLKRVLALLDETPDPCAGKKPIMLDGDVPLPSPLAALVACGHRALRWRAAGMESYLAVLPRANGRSHIIALRAAPGAALPAYRHGGMALTLVLRGSYRDETGHYTTGRLVMHEGGTVRAPIADAQGCLCVCALEDMEDKDIPAEGWIARVRALLTSPRQ